VCLLGAPPTGGTHCVRVERCVVRIEHNLALHRFEVGSNNNNNTGAIRYADTHGIIGKKLENCVASVV
jgi:hypothetical protein